jgi:lipopolysaccharide export LptBFGC system permease protein LptF
LFAALLSFGRLSSDGEITALRSSGISLFQISTPLLVVVLILTSVSLYFSASVTPWCNHRYKETYREMLLQRPTLQIKEKTITDLKGKKVYVYHLDREGYEMEKVILYEFPPHQVRKFPQITLSERGKFEGEALHLEKVTVYRIGENYRIIQRGKFDSQTIYLSNQLPGLGSKERSMEEMSLGELGEKLREERIKKEPNDEKIRKIAVDFHTRIAIPLATFFIGILAIPLGIKLERGEKSISLGISLSIIVIYYMLLSAGQFLGKEGIMPPLLAMWFPNILIIVAGIYLNLKLIRT